MEDAGKAEVISQVIELQMMLSAEIEKNRVLSAQNHQLQAQLDTKAKMTFRKKFWFQEGDEQAFCPKCWEADSKAIHVEGPVLSNNEEMFFWCCPHCKTDYYTKDEKL